MQQLPTNTGTTREEPTANLSPTPASKPGTTAGKDLKDVRAAGTKKKLGEKEDMASKDPDIT